MQKTRKTTITVIIIASFFLTTGFGTLTDLSYNGIHAVTTKSDAYVIEGNTTGGFNTPMGISITANGTCAYIMNQGSGNISEFDLETGNTVRNLTGFSGYRYIAPVPGTGLAYISSECVLSEINLTSGKIISNLSGFISISGIAVDPNGSDVYVTNLESGNLSEVNISSNTLVDNMQMEQCISGIAISPNSTYAYVTDKGTGSIYGVNLLTHDVKQTFGHLGEVSGIALNQNCYSGINAYVVGSNNLSYISLSSGKILENFTGLTVPAGVALTPNGSYAYVTEKNSNSVSRIEISQQYKVEILESKLPKGTEWFLNLSDGYSFKTKGTSINFTLPDNRYSYNIGVYNKSYDSANQTGYIRVDGGNVIQAIEFYPTSFMTQVQGFSNNENAIAIGNNGTYGYVLSDQTNITVFDIVTGSIIENITGFVDPYDMAIAPNGSYAYVTNYASHNISVINLNKGIIVRNITSSLYNYQVALSGNASYLYVTNFEHIGISMINLSTGTSHYLAGIRSQVGSMAVSRNGTYMYYSTGGDNLSVMNLVKGSFVRNITGFNNANYLSLSSNGTYVYVISDEEYSISVVNLTSGDFVENITGFNNPNGIATTPNGTYAIVTNDAGNTLSRITISHPYRVAFTESGLPAGTRWYLNLTDGYSYTSNLTQIIFTTANGSYNYSTGSSNMDYQTTDKNGYFSVSGSPLSRDISFAGVTYEVVFNESGLPEDSRWYVNVTGEPSSGSITGSSYEVALMNGTYNYSVSSPVVYYSAHGGTFKVRGENLSVNTSFVDYVYNVTFTESGLEPSGSIWYVNLTNGNSFSAKTSSISFKIGNGTFYYSVSTQEKDYSAQGGSFKVDGLPVTETLIFTEVNYTVLFNETGLQAGTDWYVNITGEQPSGKITATSFSIKLPNGTYDFNVTSTSRLYHSSMGSFEVKGKEVELNVEFSKEVYNVTFEESGLPADSAWYVNLTGMPSSVTITSAEYSIFLPNGTYSFSASSGLVGYYANSGSFTVKGSVSFITVNFSRQTYEATFTESGLPQGNSWYVNITGLETSGKITAAFYSLELINGTYIFSVSSGVKIYSPVYTGTFSIKGAGMDIPVSFKKEYYRVTFTESGLPSGTEWFANSTAGFNESSSTGIISVSLANGSYVFTIANLTYYYSETHSVKVVVDGSNVTSAITFLHWAYIDGTINHKNATVTINGINMTGLSETFNLSVAQGSYNITVYLKGFAEYHSNFTLSPGSVKNMTIDLVPVSKGKTGPSIEIYLAVGGIAAVLVLSGAYIFMKRRKG